MDGSALLRKIRQGVIGDDQMMHGPTVPEELLTLTTPLVDALSHLLRILFVMKLCLDMQILTPNPAEPGFKPQDFAKRRETLFEVLLELLMAMRLSLQVLGARERLIS